jgi:hypothetical protein
MQKLVVVMVAGAIAGSLVALAGCASAHKEEASKLDVADVPASVMHTVNTRLPGASVDKVEKEKEHGTIVYDFELKQNGRKFEMDVAESGTLLEIEKEIAAADVPPSVTHAVQSKYPSATVHEVMEVDVVKGGSEKPDHYEVTVVVSGKKHEVTVSLDGTRVGEEDEDED